jgi:hypothetical protein
MLSFIMSGEFRPMGRHIKNNGVSNHSRFPGEEGGVMNIMGAVQGIKGF